MKQITCRVISEYCDKTGQMVSFDSCTQDKFVNWVKRVCDGMISMEIYQNLIKVRFPERYEIYQLKDINGKTVYSKEMY